jgi:hypothetical protein
LGGYYKLHNPLLGIMADLKGSSTQFSEISNTHFLLYNPWSKKTIGIGQITTCSSSKPGSSSKVWISRTGGSPDLKCFKTQAVICKNQICPGHC